jgi:hypothetical protein
MATAIDSRAVPSDVAASNDQKPGRRGESFTGFQRQIIKGIATTGFGGQ